MGIGDESLLIANNKLFCCRRDTQWELATPDNPNELEGIDSVDEIPNGNWRHLVLSNFYSHPGFVGEIPSGNWRLLVQQSLCDGTHCVEEIPNGTGLFGHLNFSREASHRDFRGDGEYRDAGSRRYREASG